jgi:hypothetical protein
VVGDGGTVVIGGTRIIVHVPAAPGSPSGRPQQSGGAGSPQAYPPQQPQAPQAHRPGGPAGGPAYRPPAPQPPYTGSPPASGAPDPRPWNG